MTRRVEGLDGDPRSDLEGLAVFWGGGHGLAVLSADDFEVQVFEIGKLGGSGGGADEYCSVEMRDCDWAFLLSYRCRRHDPSGFVYGQRWKGVGGFALGLLVSVYDSCEVHLSARKMLLQNWCDPNVGSQYLVRKRVDQNKMRTQGVCGIDDDGIIRFVILD